MLIGSAAYFQVCKNCGEHGHIVFSDGTAGPEVSSKEIALIVVDEALKLKRLIDIEVPELKRQIETSKLAKYDKDACLAAQIVSDAANIGSIVEALLNPSKEEDTRIH